MAPNEKLPKHGKKQENTIYKEGKYWSLEMDLELIQMVDFPGKKISAKI